MRQPVPYSSRLRRAQPPSSKRRAIGSLFEGAVSRRLTEGVYDPIAILKDADSHVASLLGMTDFGLVTLF